MRKSDLWLIVPAAGIGQRMKAECPKQYLRINNRFILDITLSRLLDNAPFRGCMVPLNPKDQWWPESESAKDVRGADLYRRKRAGGFGVVGTDGSPWTGRG